MTAADWQALLAAFLEGRLSADTFVRRFAEGWQQNRASGRTNPDAINRLAYVVETYEPDPAQRSPRSTDETQLRTEAQLALVELTRGDQSDLNFEDLKAERIDPNRIEIDLRAAEGEVRAGMQRLYTSAAFGCLAALCWLGLAVAQFFAASAQVQSFLNWGPAPSTLLGLLAAVTPVVGGVVAFFGAKDVWGLSPWLAAGLFLVLPLVSFGFGYVMQQRVRRDRARMVRGLFRTPPGRGR